MKSNLVRREDYEVYDFILPLSKYGKKERPYIRSELEKCHPCFSEKSCIDSKRYFKKGKLYTKVFVMDKNVLAAYRKTSEDLVLMEGKKKYRIFESRKNFFFNAIIILFIFFAAFSIWSIETVFKEEDLEDVVESQVYEDTVEEISEEELSGPSEKEILSEFYLMLSESEGRIDSFSYEVLETAEGLVSVSSFEMEDCFPEDFISDGDEFNFLPSFSAVSFKGESPCFSVSFENQVNMIRIEDDDSGETDSVRMMADLRKLIGACGGTVVSSDSNTMDIDFYVSETSVVPVLDSVSEYLLIKNTGVERMYAGNAGGCIRLKMKMVRNIDNVFVVRMVRDYRSFYSGKPEPKVYVRHEEIPEAVEIPSVPEIQGEQIGLITKPDGTQVIYLRMINGEIKEVIK